VEASPSGIWNEKKQAYINKTGDGIFFQRKTYAKELDGETHLTFCGISAKAVEDRFPNGVTIAELQEQMKTGVVFNVLQGNLTKNGMVLVERARMKKYVPKM